MPSRSVDLSPRKAALVAGFAYLGILVFNTVALSLVDGLIVRGDAAATASNLTAAESLFRLGIASWVVVLALDAVVAWALYIFLEPVGRHLSLLAAWFKLVFVAVAGSALLSLFSALQLLGTAGDSTAFGRDQFEALLGVLLVAASAGYFIASFASIVYSGYADNQAWFIVFVAVPALLAEYSLAFWLLIKGGVERGRAPRLPPHWFIRAAWVAHRALYRFTGGRRGLWPPKPGRWGTMRLTTVGRRSGKERIAILGYYEDGPNLVTLAMNGWAEGEPAWWLNLQAHPDATVDLKDGSRAVRGRAAQGDERARLWARWREMGDDVDAYATLRSSETAVVILEPRPAGGA